MKKVKFNDVLKKLENNELNPYNFYNVDLDPAQVFSIEHYINNPHDNIETSQKLKKVFLDIEVFLEHKQGTTIADMIMRGQNLVNAVSHYYSSENTFYCYFVPPPGCKITEKEFEDYLNEESNKPIKIGENKDGTDKIGTYFEDGQKVKVKLFDDGVDLVISLWEKIKENDPAVISGWNADNFDIPYLYHYLLTHLGRDEEVGKVMSNFGEVYIDNSKDRAGNEIHWVRFPEYNLVDLMYCYKDRKNARSINK